jgi:hypothetical protein
VRVRLNLLGPLPDPRNASTLPVSFTSLPQWFLLFSGIKDLKWLSFKGFAVSYNQYLLLSDQKHHQNWIKPQAPLLKHLSWVGKSATTAIQLGVPESYYSFFETSTFFWVCVPIFIKMGNNCPIHSSSLLFKMVAVVILEHGRWHTRYAFFELHICFPVCVSNFIKLGQ